MNLKKYISKKFVLRALGILVILCSAVLFDAFHEGSETLVNETHQRSESVFQHSNHVFFYSQSSHFKILKGTDKLFSGLLFDATQNQFLRKYHNCRAFNILKAESLKERISLDLLVHFMEFNTCHHISPDDYFPVA